MTVSKKEKLAAFALAASIIFALLIVYIVNRNFNHFPIIDVTQMDSDHSSVSFELNDPEVYNGYIYISGRASEAEPIKSVDCSVALRGESGVVRKAKTAPYVEEFPAPNVDTTENAGFRGHIKADILSENETYDILLIYRNNGRNILVDTSIKINSAGEIVDG